jgi:carboxymethylenebutenolidase
MRSAKNIVIILIVALLGFLGGWLVFRKDMPKQNINENNNANATTSGSAFIEMLGVEGLYEVAGEPVNYFEQAKGFYAEPTEEGEYPGVVMVHEWWGLNDNIRAMSKALASQGYKVLAVDLYEGKVATTQADAQKYVTVARNDQAGSVDNMKAAVDYLRRQGSSKVGVLGWCFGGGQALQLSLSGEPLDATVIYYGTPLVTDRNEIANISWPVLGIFGDKDTAIPVATVKEFEGSLIGNDIKNEIHIYPGVGHAFANPSGQNYSPEETFDAWKKTLRFLEDNLK